MAQIAQQDNLIVEDSKHALSALGGEQKAKLKDCILCNTILDVVLVTTEAGNKVNVGRVVGYEIDNTHKDAPTYQISVCNSNNNTIVKVTL